MIFSHRLRFVVSKCCRASFDSPLGTLCGANLCAKRGGAGSHFVVVHDDFNGADQGIHPQLFAWQCAWRYPKVVKPSCPVKLVAHVGNSHRRDTRTQTGCRCFSATVMNHRRHFGKLPVMGHLVDRDDVIRQGSGFESPQPVTKILRQPAFSSAAHTNSVAPRGSRPFLLPKPRYTGAGPAARKASSCAGAW